MLSEDEQLCDRVFGAIAETFGNRLDPRIAIYESIPTEQRNQTDDQFSDTIHSGEIAVALTRFIRANKAELERITGTNV